jgi:hypothetical protein
MVAAMSKGGVTVTIQRIRWLGHVERMEDNAMPKRMLKGRLYSKRRKGRPRMRWLDDVESDLKKMEVKGWKEKMRGREQWRLVVEGAKGSPRAVVPRKKKKKKNCDYQILFNCLKTKYNVMNVCYISPPSS